MSSVRPAQGCSSFKKSLTEGRQKFLMSPSPSAQQQDRILEQCPRDLEAGTGGYLCTWPGTGHSLAAAGCARPFCSEAFRTCPGGRQYILSPPSVNLVYA